MKPADIVAGGVYVEANLTRWRRVIWVSGYLANPVVVYSQGTDHNRCCLLRTFARWAHVRIKADDNGLIEQVDIEEKETT